MYSLHPTKTIIYSLPALFEHLKTRSALGMLMLMYGLITMHFLSHYLILDSTFWGILLMTPYCFVIDDDQPGNKRFLYVSMVFLLLTLMSGILTLYLFTIGFALFYAIESLLGKLNHVPLFILALLSPTFRYFNNMFGFPVRMKLSELAGQTLHAIGYNIEVTGNVIVADGNEFSVDPACIGLKMMAISMLAGLILVVYFQRKTQKSLRFGQVFLVLSGIIVLNLTGNFLRILLLVMFKIPPEDPMHDLTGILCLMVYVVIPTYFALKWIYSVKTEVPSHGSSRKLSYKKTLLLNSLLAMCIITTGCIKFVHHVSADKRLSASKYPGYATTMVKGDILKLENPGSLIYIKPLSRFYGAEHNPMICWVGSGYAFSRISKQTNHGKEVFTGILSKGRDTIYAAWWFDNGSYQTISQLDWRWRALKGENFYLINVNATGKEQLWQQVTAFVTVSEHLNR